MKTYSVYYRVSTNGHVRFESLLQAEAEHFARDLYKTEDVIAEIDEVTR